MLKITVPGIEGWDIKNNVFVDSDDFTLHLEHSLVSLSKWESRWHKPFLTKEDKTIEETIDYIRCMTLTQHVPEDVYTRITDENIQMVNAYISDPMTATTFQEEKKGRSSREKVTSEIIYHWMISFNIPVEFQKWHLNRLMTLIRVCEIKNSPPKKMSLGETISRHRALNKARREKYKSQR